MKKLWTLPLYRSIGKDGSQGQCGEERMTVAEGLGRGQEDGQFPELLEGLDDWLVAMERRKEQG